MLTKPPEDNQPMEPVSPLRPGQQVLTVPPSPDYFDLTIPRCPSVRIQKTPKNLYGRLVDPAQPDEDFGTCYSVPIMEGGNMIAVECPEDGKRREVYYRADIICLANKCGGPYDEKYKRIPGKPVLGRIWSSVAIAPRAAATFTA
jgi:hypothetical protein